jgi:hypothetical protein
MTSTDIVKCRKTNDYENFEKGMIYMKILKKGGSREKGEEETKSMPHAPVYKISKIAKIVNFSGKCYIGGFKHLVGSKV